MTRGGFSFALLTAGKDFDALESEWTALLERSSADPLFCSFPWTRTWWRVYRRTGELRLVTARDESGKLVGIAPYYLRTANARDLEREMVGDVRLIVGTRGPKYKVLSPLGAGEVCSDFLGFIAEKGLENEIWSALYSFLHKDVGGFDILELPDADENTQGIEGLQYAAMSGRHTRYRTSYCAPYAFLPGTYEDYLNTLSKKSRYNARKKVKMLSIYHKVEHYFHEDAGSLDLAMEIFYAMHAERWKSEGKTGVFQSERMYRFHKAMAREGLTRGWLRLGILMVNGEPCFATYAYHVGERVYLYQQGSTTKYPEFNLGYVALAFTIQDACERGAHYYDFLRGEADYKLHWAKTSRQLVQFLAFRTLHASRFYARSFLNTDPKVRGAIKRLIGRGK